MGYTEVICTHQQTIFAAAQGIISHIHSGKISVVSNAGVWQHGEARTSNSLLLASKYHVISDHIMCYQPNVSSFLRL